MLFYVKLFTSDFLNEVSLKHIYVANIHFFTVFRNSASNRCRVCLPSLIIALIAIACSQCDKLRAAILDIRQQHTTPQHRQEDEEDHTTANCDLQAKLNACIRHHQDIIE